MPRVIESLGHEARGEFLDVVGRWETERNISLKDKRLVFSSTTMCTEFILNRSHNTKAKPMPTASILRRKETKNGGRCA
jgi:hypothetical protein